MERAMGIEPTAEAWDGVWGNRSTASQHGQAGGFGALQPCA